MHAHDVSLSHTHSPTPTLPHRALLSLRASLFSIEILYSAPQILIYTILSTMAHPYRTLDEALANTPLASEPSASLKRKWAAASSSKSSESTSSYDGPIVKIAKFNSSTANLTSPPGRILPVPQGPKLDEWRSCREEVTRLLQEDNFNYQSVGIFYVQDRASSGGSRPTILIGVPDTEEQSR